MLDSPLPHPISSSRRPRRIIRPEHSGQGVDGVLNSLLGHRGKEPPPVPAELETLPGGNLLGKRHIIQSIAVFLIVREETARGSEWARVFTATG
jgi:hypothetical protein